MKVMLVCSHQTYGDGAGFVWRQMDTEKWRELTSKYVDCVRWIAQQYAGQNLCGSRKTYPGLIQATLR